jgi:hypothetical protein
MLRQLNLMPRVPLDLTALNSPDDTVGPGPGHSWHLVHREYDDAVPCTSKL